MDGKPSCRCGNSESKSETEATMYIKLERLLLELGWDVPMELKTSCTKCLESMLNDVQGELTATQSRSIATTDQMFQVVDPNTEPYRMAVSRFNDSVKAQVIRVEQINNPQLLVEFESASGTGGEFRWLFHGSNNANYVSIAKNGFDKGRSKNGLLGVGVYFAENASYSTSYTNNVKEVKGDTVMGNMLLCKVNIQRGDQKGTNIHCIRDDRRAYPQYIIYYKHIWTK